MNITRKRFIVMRNNRSEVWCGLSKHFYFKPVSEVKDTSVKTYRSQAQAEAGCSSWDRNFEVVPATETIVIDPVTNADRIRAMSDEELTEFLSRIAYGRKTPWSDQFAKKFCSSCPTTEYKSECYLKPMHLHECDFTDGKCPNGNEIVWWLRQPAEEETT